MRSAARDLNFFQYYCVDVVAVLVTVLLTILYVLYMSARLCLRKVVGLFLGAKPTTDVRKKKVKFCSAVLNKKQNIFQ